VRHVTVARLALGLVAFLAAALALFAWHQVGASPRGARVTGAAVVAGERPEELFARQCAVCHELEELAAGLREAADPAQAVLDLLLFLTDHGATDGAQDLGLAALLLQCSRTPR